MNYKTTKFSLLLLASVSIWTSAQASPLVSIGDNADLFFNGSTSLEWTSNVFRDEDDEVDDVLWTISPGFELNVGRGLGNADLSIVTRYDIRRYMDNDQLDTELFSIRAVGSYTSSRLDLSGNLGFANAKSSTGDNTFNNDLVESDVINGRLDAEYRFSPKFSFGSGVSYTQREYKAPFDAFFADRETFRVPFDLFYELTPKVDLSVGYSYSQTEVDPTVLNPLGGYTAEDHFLNVGARGNLLPKLSGFFKVGYRTRENDRPGSTSNSTLGLDADFTWTATPKLTSRLGLHHGFGVGGEGQSTENSSIDLNASYSISTHYALSSFVSYNLRDYESGREDHQYRLGAHLSYTPNEFWRFGGGYTYSENDSDTSNRSYVDHTFDISASLRY